MTGYFYEYRTGDYAGFITNREMNTDTAEKLLELYERRWNIENGFKEAKDFLIKTTSKNHAYRLLLYAISHLIANLQNIIRDTRFRVRYYEMQEIRTTNPRPRDREERVHHNKTTNRQTVANHKTPPTTPSSLATAITPKHAKKHRTPHRKDTKPTIH